MGIDQSKLEKWIDTISADQVHPQLTAFFLSQRGGSYPDLPERGTEQLFALQQNFKAHCTPKKKWTEGSFASFLSKQLPPGFPDLSAASHIIFTIATTHASYPFPLTSTPTELDFDELLRAVVLLSSRTRTAGNLNRKENYFMMHDSNNERERYAITNPGRTEMDRRRLLFQSLAAPRFPAPYEDNEQPLEDPSPKPDRNAEGKTIITGIMATRNQDCEPRDRDILDVLSLIQPTKGLMITCDWGWVVDPAPRISFREVAKRMPRGRMPEMMAIPSERLETLLRFVLGVDFYKTGMVKVAEKVDEDELRELMKEFGWKAEKRVEWERFNSVLENKNDTPLVNLYRVFDLLMMK